MALPEKILQYLDKNGSADSLSLAEILKEDGQKIVGAIKSLDSLGDVICVEQFLKKQLELTSEGSQVVENGSHEARVYNAVPQQGIPQTELMKIVPNAKVGFSKAMSAGWITLDKSSGQPVVRRKVEQISDVVQQSLAKILEGKIQDVTEEQKQEYKKRKLLQEIVVKGFMLTKGSAFSLSVSKPETDLTPEMIAQGTWRNKQFKDYNLGALGVPPPCGHLHPLLKVRTEFRQIFLEMGFTEMPTNNYVESSFWNFDALYVPQQHPARDAHDTFFMSKPKTSNNFPMDYLERVKSAHSEGGFGSQGYKYDWKIEESQKNVLRTHTTAVSARMLHALAKKGFQPVKFFSIDKVFRNETLDATHLAEFHQVEGVVAGYNISLGDLIGLLYEFFKKLGIEKLYFKPTFNPYTEPSMEIFSYHEGLKKWIEIGNSGMFRPEMLLPMGLPENVNVLGYGLSLERPTMIKYGIDNIRDLVGPKVDLQMVHDSPICRIDKDDNADNNEEQQLEQQWDELTSRLQALQCAVKNLKTKLGMQQQQQENNENFNITIFADPQIPPYSLFILIALLQKHVSVNVSSHCHSTAQKVPEHLIKMMELLTKNDTSAANRVTFIWKPVGIDLELSVSPILHTKLIGEVTAVRYLSRLIESNVPNLKWFEQLSYDHSTKVDLLLDQIHTLSGSKSTQNFINSLSDKSYLISNLLTPADIYLLSVLKNIKIKIPNHLQNWYKNCKTNDWIALFI